MDNVLERDFISDLPARIINTILTKLPVRDAVRTSILSSTWRYKWATLTQVEFDDRCVTLSNNKVLVENNLVKFITQFLFLHNGPIHKFMLSTAYLQISPEIDQWLLFLSRKDIKELDLELGERGWFRAPSCLFCCRNLIRLKLVRCKLDPPLTFKGLLCLKYLNLQNVLMAPDAIESLISSCSVLESLTLSYFKNVSLTICAPNLKYLCLEGEFKDICLKNTPLLVTISVAMYLIGDIAEHFEQSFSCNFDKFLGGVPFLERLTGRSYFTKYLSIGYNLGKPPITYCHLKIVELYQVSFEDMIEILAVIRLIVNSPNLQELHISSTPSTTTAVKDPDLNFWEKECLSGCMFKQLKTVKMTDMFEVPREMDFIRFLLGNSPVLEIMSVTPSETVTEGRLNKLIELVKFPRASTKAEIIFTQD